MSVFMSKKRAQAERRSIYHNVARPEASRHAMLLGSSELPSVITLPNGKELPLGELVGRAKNETGLSVDDWNGLPQEEREAFLKATLEKVLHEAAPLDANGLRTDGPTLEEYVAAGYDAKGYPPQGYAAKPSTGSNAGAGTGSTGKDKAETIDMDVFAKMTKAEMQVALKAANVEFADEETKAMLIKKAEAFNAAQ